VAGGLWFLHRAHYFSAWLSDDAFISFCYPNDLLAHHGLVSNPGERVEGCSNLLWTLALPTALDLDTDRAAQLLGRLLDLAGIFVSYRLAQRPG
jgi:hypothetical protein